MLATVIELPVLIIFLHYPITVSIIILSFSGQFGACTTHHTDLQAKSAFFISANVPLHPCFLPHHADYEAPRESPHFLKRMQPAFLIVRFLKSLMSSRLICYVKLRKFDSIMN